MIASMRPDRNANLHAIFAPSSVALIGATERPASVGRSLLENLTGGGFKGSIYPISLTHDTLLGKRAYRTIAAAPGPVDLAVIATPAATVPALLGECADAGVRGTIVISAGFREIGAAGADLEAQTLAQAQRGGVRVIGPNCIGIIVPRIGLNATFANGVALPGSVGFVSQSGALCTAVLDWSVTRNVGFSHFVSAGSMVDVGWHDYLDYLSDDLNTKSILLYIESIGDPAAFVSSAREAAFVKPVIVMKAGRTPAASRAAASHTGALAGSDDVLDAALRRCGVLRVDSVEDLFDMAEVLAKGPRPRGKRLGIVTNAGGPGVIAADALVGGGGDVADLAPNTIAALDALLPKHWSRANPVDVFGDADVSRYAKAVEIVCNDANVDATLVIYAPQAVAPPTETARSVTQVRAGKPLLASWMGGAGVADGRAILDRAGISTFSYPEGAIKAFNYLWRYDDNLRGLYETPTLPPDGVHDKAGAAKMIAAVRRAGRTALTAPECAQILSCYGLDMIGTVTATSPDEAVAAADHLGYPVAVKLHSTLLLHKTDVGGVHLNVVGADGVRDAYEVIRSETLARAGPEAFLGVIVQPMIRGEGYELIAGSTVDKQFGPVIAFGLGGQLVEVFRDSALALPPLNGTLARRLMERTRVYRALCGVRGRRPVDIDRLETQLVRLGTLVMDQPWIREIDLNPLYVDAKRIVALDARIVLHDLDAQFESLPRPVIRPYPAQYAGTWTKDGTTLTIRPIRPEDEPLVRAFHRKLSDESVYMRFAHVVGLDTRIAHEWLARSCFIDYGREITLVAERVDAATGAAEILGIGTIIKTRRPGEAEFALLIGDAHQGEGIGTELLRRLLGVATAEGYKRVVGHVLASNGKMRSVCSRLNFVTTVSTGDPVVHAVFNIVAEAL
jgi:acetyltransferase